MDKILEIISTLNLPTVMAMGIVFWYFTRDLKKEIRVYEDKLDVKIEAQAKRTDKLYEMFIDLLKNRNEKNG